MVKVLESKPAGQDIFVSEGAWSFEGLDGRAFETHLRHSIPLYLAGQDLLVDLAEFYLHRAGRVYDLGCSTGGILLKLAAKVASPQVQFIGIDNSESLLNLAREKATDEPRAQFIAADLQSVEYKSAQVVSAYYTLQFLPYLERSELLRQIYQALNPGGALFVFEKVLEPSSRLQEYISQAYLEFKRKSGFSDEEILAKARSLKGVLHPLSSEDNKGMFFQAGFKDINLIFKYLCFEGYICTKPYSV